MDRIRIEDINGLTYKSQAINYCEADGIADGLLINFGGKSLDFKRVYNKNLVHPKKDVVVQSFENSKIEEINGSVKQTVSGGNSPSRRAENYPL